MPDIKHLLKIKANNELVYSAIATVEGLASWWTPQTSGNSAEGGVLQFNFGPAYFKKMRVKMLRENTDVHWQCLEAVEEWVGTTVTFEIEPLEEEVVLHFSHANWKNYTRLFSQCSFDWAMFLRSLKAYCELGEGLPFPNQGRVDSVLSN